MKLSMKCHPLSFTKLQISGGRIRDDINFVEWSPFLSNVVFCSRTIADSEGFTLIPVASELILSSVRKRQCRFLQLIYVGKRHCCFSFFVIPAQPELIHLNKETGFLPNLVATIGEYILLGKLRFLYFRHISSSSF
jgi:hypothetical protein